MFKINLLPNELRKIEKEEEMHHKDKEEVIVLKKPEKEQSHFSNWKINFNKLKQLFKKPKKTLPENHKFIKDYSELAKTKNHDKASQNIKYAKNIRQEVYQEIQNEENKEKDKKMQEQKQEQEQKKEQQKKEKEKKQALKQADIIMEKEKIKKAKELKQAEKSNEQEQEQRQEEQEEQEEEKEQESKMLNNYPKAKIPKMNLIKQNVIVYFNFSKIIYSFLLVAVISSIIIGLIYGGIYLIKMEKVKETKKFQFQINKIDREIAFLEKQLPEIIEFQKKLKDRETLLKNHIYWTPFFEQIEKYTLPNVYYSGLNVNTSGQINLSAITDNYDSINKQITVFNNAKNFIKEARINSASITLVNKKQEVGKKEVEKSYVKFEVFLKLNKDIFHSF